MSNLNGFKIAICQMESIPLDPIRNANYMVGEIQKAADRGQHVIVFPEVCIHDYLNGDAIESVDLLRDIEIANLMVEQASASGIIVIFGSVVVDWAKKGEDGRVRKSNAGIIAQDGRRVYVAVKTLQPKYRMFFDPRHFFSLRQIAEEISLETGAPFEAVIRSLLIPVKLDTLIGPIKFGLDLCEDMWKDDYNINPSQILVDNGAEIIFNLSASPCTWRKNEKRHRVVANLFTGKRVPFVYVNKTGFNQQGKSGYPFDGASTIYNDRGGIVFQFPQYIAGTINFEYHDNSQVIIPKSPDDAEQSFLMARCTAKGMLKTIPDDYKILIGLSGGKDSAGSAALYAHVAGPGRVVGVNMPYKSMNSKETKDDARQIAVNLGIEYLVVPIDEAVDALALATGVDPSDEVQFGNLQALVRTNVLNGLSKSPKYKGVFTCNSNKTEMAFNYGTLYADIAGWFGVLMDFVAREVYQLCDYMNRRVYGWNVIPESVFIRYPSAELQEGQQDPFDYGGITKHGFDPNERGYHDEMVRALTEFSWDWSDFLAKYQQGTLEKDLMLKAGRLDKLFATPQAFVKNLEWCRSLYYYFKRLQAPPGPIFTKRGYGDDKRESLHMAALSQRFLKLKEEILAVSVAK